MKIFNFSLRTRLFLGFGGLVVLLVLAQVWLVRSLTRELATEVDRVALKVGSSVASFFTFSSDSSCTDCQTSGEAEWLELDGHASRLEAMAQRVSQMTAGSDAKIWVWSPTSNQLIEAPGHEVRVIIPSTGSRADAEQAQPDSSEPDPSDAPAAPASTAPASTAHLQDVPSSETTTSVIATSVIASSDSASSGTHASAHVQTFQLPFGANAQVHLTGDVDARTLLLERPDLRAEVPIPRLGLREKLENFQRRLWLGSGLLLALGLVVAGLVAHRISAPLAKLADAAERVGAGELGIQVAATSGGREIRRTLGAFNEMSKRLASFERRNRRLEALRHLEEIGDIARGLAHSLRNPLNALGLSVEQLASPQTGEKRRRNLVETAGRQVRRLDAGIRSFLVLASPGEEAGVQEVALAELVRDVALEALQDAGGRVGVDLDLETGDLEAGEVLLPAVVAELRAVVQALVVNAVEASPDGERVRVRLRGKSAGGARLEVEDRGSGLPSEVRKHLFTPHVSTKPNGSGMGLFLAHRIAGFRYGGKLELLDREGGGTLARLEIGPRRRLDDTSEESSEAASEETAQANRGEQVAARRRPDEP